MPTQEQINAWQQKRKDGTYEDVVKAAAEAYYEAIKAGPETSQYIKEGEIGIRAGMGGYVDFEEFYEANSGTFNEVLSNISSKEDCRYKVGDKCYGGVSDEQFKQFSSEAELLDFLQRNAEVATARAVKIAAELDEAAFTLIDPSKGYMRSDIASTASFLARQRDLQEEQSLRAQAITRAVGELDMIAFSEQCFLMSQVFNLIDIRLKKEDEYGISVNDNPNAKFDNAKGRGVKYVDYTATDPAGNLIHTDPPQILAEGYKYPPNMDGTNNNTLLIDGSPYNFMNKMTQTADYSNFFDMTVADISNLQPSIRLYKVIQDENGNEIEHEIQFDSHYTQNDLEMFQSKKTRGVGVGIKSFDFSFEATDYYSIKKAIKAKLVIHANDFNELLRTRKAEYLDSNGDPKTAEYQYIDMALKTSNTPTAEFGDKLNRKSEMIFNSSAKLNFRLKAVVGWAVPNQGALSSTGLRNAIYNSYITLQLTPTVHSFDFDDLGRCTFTIPYLAYAEDFYDSPQFNIFTDPLTVSILEQRETKTDALNSFCDSDTQKKITEDEEDTINAETQYMKGRLFTHLMSKAIVDDAIRYIPLKYSDIKEFNKLGAGFDYTSYFNNITTSTADESMTLQIINDAAASKGEDSIKLGGVAGAGVDYLKVYDENANFNVNFFYLSDMIDVIMKGIEESFDVKSRTLETLASQYPSYVGVSPTDWVLTIQKRLNQVNLFQQQFKKLRVVLGPMEIVDPKDASNSKMISIGDLPISTKYFQEWMISEVEQKDKAIFSLSNFLNSFLNQFVRDTLNVDTCFRGQIKQSTKISQAAVTAYKESENHLDAISDKIVTEGWNGRYNISEFPDSEMPLLATAGDRNLPGGRPMKNAQEREIHYLMFYAGRTQPQEAQNGDRTQDHNRGVFHYGIGQQKGIVKTINFQRQSVPSLKMVAFEQNGYKGITQLREQYDVNIKTYANVKAQPGSYIYVEPQSFAPGAKIELTELGVGGYYMIMRSEHKFGPGLAESVITAKWVHGLHEFPPSDDSKVNEEVKEVPRGKCSIRP